jgi:hypothetical protein
MRIALALTGVLAAAALAGCATTTHQPPQVSAAPHACPAGQSRATTAELVFGRNIGQSLGVTDADWRKFLDEDVTPRFPEGFSVMDVQGQWRASNGVLIHEPSKVVYLILDGGPDDPAKIANIRDAYKRRFKQEAVLLVTKQACVSF